MFALKLSHHDSTSLYPRYSDNWCGGSLEYLDDKYCAKIFPASFDRSWACPVPLLHSIDHSHYQTDGQLQDMKVDTSILDDVVADTAVNLCVVLTQRLYNASSKTGSTLYHRYLCAGDRSKDVAYETWSRWVAAHVICAAVNCSYAFTHSCGHTVARRCSQSLMRQGDFDRTSPIVLIASSASMAVLWDPRERLSLGTWSPSSAPMTTRRATRRTPWHPSFTT